MLVTLFGIEILVKAVQFWNALSPILVTPEPIVTLVIEVLSLHALTGIDPT
jgi:hypothetical protein